MTVWLLRAGKYGQDEGAALEQGLSIIGWHELPKISDINDYEDMKTFFAKYYPDKSQKAVINHASQVWAFYNRIKVGDIAVLPLKTGSSTIALGKVAGPYAFKDGRHVRRGRLGP